MERAAYNLALWGDAEGLEGTPSDGDFAASCRDQAATEFQTQEVGVPALAKQPPWDELFAQLAGLSQTVEQDPQLGDLNRKWCDCMTDRGYPNFITHMDARASILEKTRVLADHETGLIDPEDQKTLEQEEIALAVADEECQLQTSYRDKRLSLEFAAEQKFIDKHCAELDGYVAALLEADRH